MGCCNSKEFNDDNYYIDKIQTFIKTDVNIRLNRGGKIDMSTQLKNERIEIICMGCLEYSLPDMEILFRDQKIPNTNYRPDLIFKRNNEIFYIEIDERKHKSYDKNKEEERYNTIEKYCRDNYGSFKIIKFNPNEYISSNSDSPKNKFNAATQFVMLIKSINGLTFFREIN